MRSISERAWLPYLLLCILPLVAGAVVLGTGVFDPPAQVPTGLRADAAAVTSQSPFALFLLQLLLVLACAKAAGAFMRFFRQPAVIGEMLAGILLGPSLFGLLLPTWHAGIFPANSLAGLNLVSQLGVLVFMFAAGAEFRPGSLQGQRRRALLVSHAGIALPFLLGLFLAIPLHAKYAPVGVPFSSFGLFLGMALSITALPVLLRILEERGYRERPIGRIAIACAALGDATAWGMLGIIVAHIQSTGPLATALTLTLVLAVVWVCARWLRRGLARRLVNEKDEPRWILLLVLAALTGGLVTEAIGLHALFGAFIAGTVVSGNARLRNIVEQRIGPFATIILLPLFFASTGLRTRIDLLGAEQWLLCAAIVAVATFGKLGGTFLAARVSGMDRADAWRLGTLMNTRGLMELIVLGLGYDLGLLDRSLYSILVVVAVVTTVMTGPLLGLIDRLAEPKPQG